MSTTYTEPTSDSNAFNNAISSPQDSSLVKNLFLTVPSELLRRIVYYLHPTDALILTSSNILDGRVNVGALLPPTPLPSMRTDDRNFHGDVSQMYEPRIPLPCDISNIHSMTVRMQWKDQGWGNQKGCLFIVATPKTRTVHVPAVPNNETSTDEADELTDVPFDGGRVVATTSICAPHEWERTELTFSPIDSEYYYIWYRVGGGGGHALYLKDVEVQTFVFDDPNSTCTKTYECLCNVGCLNSKKGQAPIRTNGEPRWTRIPRHHVALPIYNVQRPSNRKDLFYPTMLLSVCRSLQQMKECEQNSAGPNQMLSPVLEFLSDHSIPIDKQSLDAIIDFIQTDINEGDVNWKIYEENCRNLRLRHNVGDENDPSATDRRNPRRVVPIELRNATVNGFRMVFPIAGRRPRGGDPPVEENNNGGNNNDNNNEADENNGIHLDPIDDAAMPQVINNPDGTFTINLGNFDDLAAGAVPIDVADMHPGGGMDVDPPNVNDPENEEMFGIARAAMAAVFGFPNGNDGNVGDNHDDNNNNDRNGGFHNFFRHVNGGRGGAVGGGIFVGGGNLNGQFQGVGGGGFPFQDIIDRAINNNNNNHPARPPQQNRTAPVNDQVMTDIDDDDHDDDDDIEEVF